jgi:hypothetical protein
MHPGEAEGGRNVGTVLVVPDRITLESGEWTTGTPRLRLRVESQKGNYLLALSPVSVREILAALAEVVTAALTQKRER